MKKVVAFVILIFLCLANASAKIEDGIVFKSYNVQPEERTSLSIPAAPGGHISFSDSLTLSFSLKVNLEIGHFGYICRMLLDNSHALDIVLSPKGSETIICATGDHHSAVPVLDDGSDIGLWTDIYIRAFNDGDSLVFSANGREVMRTENSRGRHQVKIIFGKSDIPGLVTSDVAPFHLADLQIRRDSHKVVSWMLSGPEDLSTRGGISIKAVNHVFSRDLNIHWTKIMQADVPSITYCTFSRDHNKVFFVSKGQVLVYDIPSGTQRVIPFSTDIKPGLNLDHFEVLPDGTLCCADAPAGEFIRFSGSDWERESTRERTSIHLHNNSVYAGGLFYQMFGYGQHRYSNSVWIWNPDTFTFSTGELKGVEPRYLAGAGEKDGKIYILGGKGNETGQQELGVSLFDSLIQTDPVTLESKVLWKNPVLQKYSPAKDLVFVEDKLYALLFNPEVHDSSLRLTRFSMEEGRQEFLSEPIPFPFLDIASQARLAFVEDQDCFVAAVCYQDDNKSDKVELYLIANPVITEVGGTESVMGGGIPVWLWLLVALAIIAACTVFFIFKNRRSSSPLVDDVDVPAGEPIKPTGPGIYLLGGFQVRDTEGKDITSTFSPTLMQLLSILVLYTAEKGGVSNAKLKSILWPDKSDTSFNNNKGVYLKKLRDALEQVGSVSILQDGGVWKIEDGTSLCDFFVAKQRLGRGEGSDVLGVASWGPLLPEYQFEWLDPFKAAYTDTIIGQLSSIASSGVSPAVLLRIAECRLLFDSLDEDAILLKCQALVSLGRSGTASSVFQRFTADYLNVMGEEFPKDFTSFLKK